MSAGSSPADRRGGPVILAAAAVVVAVVVAAWVLQAGSGGEDGPSAGGSSSGYSVTVRQGGEVRGHYDLAALRALPQATVVIEGKEQEGPRSGLSSTTPGSTGSPASRSSGPASATVDSSSSRQLRSTGVSSWTSAGAGRSRCARRGSTAANGSGM